MMQQAVLVLLIVYEIANTICIYTIVILFPLVSVTLFLMVFKSNKFVVDIPGYMYNLLQLVMHA